MNFKCRSLRQCKPIHKHSHTDTHMCAHILVKLFMYSDDWGLLVNTDEIGRHIELQIAKFYECLTIWENGVHSFLLQLLKYITMHSCCAECILCKIVHIRVWVQEFLYYKMSHASIRENSDAIYA